MHLMRTWALGAAQHFAYQHARQGGDLIESINFWRPAANDTKRLGST
jgi:hypothetical protein